MSMDPPGPKELNRLAFSATGGSIGEVLGMVIGTALDRKTGLPPPE
jgi:hypothetical protein